MIAANHNLRRNYKPKMPTHLESAATNGGNGAALAAAAASADVEAAPLLRPAGSGGRMGSEGTASTGHEAAIVATTTGTASPGQGKSPPQQIMSQRHAKVAGSSGRLLSSGSMALDPSAAAVGGDTAYGPIKPRIDIEV
jgi:hypothetical protein